MRGNVQRAKIEPVAFDIRALGERAAHAPKIAAISSMVRAIGDQPFRVGGRQGGVDPLMRQTLIQGRIQARTSGIQSHGQRVLELVQGRARSLRCSGGSCQVAHSREGAVAPSTAIRTASQARRSLRLPAPRRSRLESSRSSVIKISHARARNWRPLTRTAPRARPGGRGNRSQEQPRQTSAAWTLSTMALKSRIIVSDGGEDLRSSRSGLFQAVINRE